MQYKLESHLNTKDNDIKAGTVGNVIMRRCVRSLTLTSSNDATPTEERFQPDASRTLAEMSHLITSVKRGFNGNGVTENLIKTNKMISRSELGWEGVRHSK